jgi:GNAT superfamily N-acetyltransferase
MVELSVRRVDSDADLERWVELYNVVVPHDPETVESTRHGLTIDPDRLHLLGLADGDPVGYASIGRWHAAAADAPAAWMQLGVVPRSRRLGVGGMLLRAVSERARSRERSELVCLAREGETQSLAFLQQRGFRLVDRIKMVALDLRTTPSPPPRPLPDGVAIVTLADRPGLVDALYALAVEALPDIPDDEPVVAGDLRHWRSINVDNPGVRHDAFLVALAGGEVAGFASLFISPADLSTGWHHMTAVARAHRGRGIAGSLKQTQVGWAREHGIERLKTGNNERNEPIRRLNRRFGYRPEPDGLLFRGPAA